jgi:hypothetical protein
MAACAALPRYRRLVPRLFVAAGALGIDLHLPVRMGVVAGKAGQLPLAFDEAGRLAQINRLMARVPWIVPVDVDTLGGWHAVALPAQFIDPDSIQLAGMLNVVTRGPGGVLPTGAMAGFAPDSRFGRFNRAACG